MISDIDKYLRQKNKSLDNNIEYQIFALKEDAVQSKNEALANTLWCYGSIYKIQQLYLNAYKHLKQAAYSNDIMIDNYDSEKSREYEAAWNDLDQCDINISFLEKCFCIADSQISDYHIGEILHDIKMLQPLFPYKLFLSRETVIKEQRCSICGKVVTVRHPCGHIPGKLYMGKMCGREITDFSFICETIVTSPFDKYAILKVEGQRFSFKILDSLVLSLEPYSIWSYTVEKRLLPQFYKVGRNEKCPCGSGMKFKHCIIKKPKLHYEDHYKVQLMQ